ncbi:unnamed protein product, partial [Brugia timori]|uniref:Ovule protein n=1 Tax=Brugia timori TaxID=42155 RepID=A0A0R3QRD3_9BILA
MASNSSVKFCSIQPISFNKLPLLDCSKLLPFVVPDSAVAAIVISLNADLKSSTDP